ncbi:ABC transporter permease [Lautropia dentalis]|uniref:ABC transporter permease n=1 Tax=Lautropia dentalis TaxID=2490857 RepID=UPI0019398A45|nr:ABC transporter permease [Lautropia dentalis]
MVLHYALMAATICVAGALLGVLAGMAGASQAVLRAVREPVAQAMRPQPPERYRVAGIGQGLVARYLPQPARMVLRHLVRHPGRALLTVAGLAMLVNFGVVYNAARITLAERMRELASLRVLGFTRSEVAHILMGEIGLLVLLSIPLSFACGWGLGWLMVQGMQNDLYRVPLTLPPEGYALAALVTLTSTLVSMAAVLRLMNRMDMLEVLQNRV